MTLNRMPDQVKIDLVNAMAREPACWSASETMKKTETKVSTARHNASNHTPRKRKVRLPLHDFHLNTLVELQETLVTTAQGKVRTALEKHLTQTSREISLQKGHLEYLEREKTKEVREGGDGEHHDLLISHYKSTMQRAKNQQNIPGVELVTMGDDLRRELVYRTVGNSTMGARCTSLCLFTPHTTTHPTGLLILVVFTGASPDAPE
jgi:hypothetical protein